MPDSARRRDAFSCAICTSCAVLAAVSGSSGRLLTAASAESCADTGDSLCSLTLTSEISEASASEISASSSSSVSETVSVATAATSIAPTGGRAGSAGGRVLGGVGRWLSCASSSSPSFTCALDSAEADVVIRRTNAPTGGQTDPHVVCLAVTTVTDRITAPDLEAASGGDDSSEFSTVLSGCAAR